MPARVLHVLPHRGGGAESYIDMLERAPGFVHERFYLSSGRTPAEALASVPFRWPRLAVRLRAVDLVHCHGDAASTISLPLLAVRPAVVTTHGLHLVRRSLSWRGMFIRRSLRAVASAANVVICTSAAENSELAGVVKRRDQRKLRVIRNGVDPPISFEQTARHSTREELGVGDETVLGLFVGQLEARKAPALAASAAREVHAAGAPFVLAVAGEGPQADEVRSLGGEAVRCLGFRTDLARLFNAADLFVQPSEREGMSLALLEAMAYGVAVVAADGPGNPEAVGDAGVLFAAGNQAALVQALMNVTRDPARRMALGESARARALEEFGADRFIDETSAVYQECLQRQRRIASSIR
jgi:glycosyltransferase involved in cell wall biosynthesis